MMRMYNIESTDTGKDVSVGTVSFYLTGTFSSSNLEEAQVHNGVPNNPIPGFHNIASTSTLSGESDLDVQMMYWAASSADLWFD